MQLPQPPTDNLYKFLSISGIILLAIGLFFYYNVYKSIADIAGQITVTKSETSILKNGVEREEKNIVSIATLSGELAKDDIIKNVASIEAKLIQYNYYISIAQATMNIANKLIRIGAFTTIIGFSAWYFKVQRYEDIILTKKAGIKKRNETISFFGFSISIDSVYVIGIILCFLLYWFLASILFPPSP